MRSRRSQEASQEDGQVVEVTLFDKMKHRRAALSRSIRDTFATFLEAMRGLDQFELDLNFDF